MLSEIVVQLIKHLFSLMLLCEFDNLYNIISITLMPINN